MPKETVSAKARVARHLFREGQIDRDYAGQQRCLALPYLLEAGCDPYFLASMFNNESVWQLPPDNVGDLYQLPVEQVLCLQPRYASLQHISTLSLDHLFDEGFSRHDAVHIEPVLHRASRILTMSSYNSEDAQRRLTLSAIPHDLGNIWSRLRHSMVSARVWPEILPALKEDAKQWRTIRRAIQLHDEPVAFGLIESLLGEMTVENFSSVIMGHFGPEALALIIADKTDVHPRRQSMKASPQDIERNPHLVNNLLAQTYHAGLTARDTFEWRLAFRLSIVGSDDPRRGFEVDDPEDGKRVQVPVAFEEKRRDGEQNYFQSWQTIFWQYNERRVALTAMAAFALFPDLARFVMQFDDEGLPARNIPPQRVRTSLSREEVYELVKKFAM